MAPIGARLDREDGAVFTHRKHEQRADEAQETPELSNRRAWDQCLRAMLGASEPGRCILWAVSLTELSLALWQHAKLPVAALAAQHAARLTLQHIDEGQREVFDASLTRLIAWWPERRKRTLLDVWNEVHPEPIRIRDELTRDARKAAEVCVRALYIQAANLERVGRGRRELPTDCYAVEPEGFEALLRDAIRLHKTTQISDLARRLSVLEELAGERPWADVVETAERMGWTRTRPGLRKLPPRLRDLAEALDEGGQAEMVDVGGRPALRVTRIGGARRLGVLSDEEMATLREVIPWIGEAGPIVSPVPEA